MFGYIRAETEELKVREYTRYRGYYCGLCRSLSRQYGLGGRLTLTYDMTFLVLLLSSLYEEREEAAKRACIVHPFRRNLQITTEASAYGADLNLILSYEKLQDDWQDEKKKTSAAAAFILKRRAKKACRKYPEKARAVKEELRELFRLEQSHSNSLDAVSGCFGRLMAELFAYRHDEWENTLRELGHHMGRFIYLADAWEDYEKDTAEGCYNVLSEIHEDDPEERKELVNALLTEEMGLATKAFEFLPLERDAGILRNILYAGCFSRLKQAEAKKKQTTGRHKADRTISTAKEGRHE